MNSIAPPGLFLFPSIYLLIKIIMKKIKNVRFIILLFLVTEAGFLYAQSGVNGLNTATSTLKTYVDPASNIALVIGGIVGIVGGIRVYSKWNSGDQDINKELMGWGGSCLFLVLSSLIVKAFFGL
jgi:hypothetical protein